jgi:hypothetical protein
VQLLLAPFQSVQTMVIFAVAVGISAGMVYLVLRSIMSAEGRPRGWVRTITGVNAKLVFGIAFVAWALIFGLGLQFVPHQGANSPYGGLALIAMFSGVFIMMGFLWAVIGE